MELPELPEELLPGELLLLRLLPPSTRDSPRKSLLGRAATADAATEDAEEADSLAIARYSACALALARFAWALASLEPFAVKWLERPRSMLSRERFRDEEDGMAL